MLSVKVYSAMVKIYNNSHINVYQNAVKIDLRKGKG